MPLTFISGPTVAYDALRRRSFGDRRSGVLLRERRIGSMDSGWGKMKILKKPSVLAAMSLVAVILASMHWGELTQNLADRVLAMENLLLLW